MDEATLERRPRVWLMRRDSAEAIAQEVRTRGVTWVWVEGFPQAGKSVFAASLAGALGWEPAIHLDHMLLGDDQQPECRRYDHHLDLERVRAIVDTGRPLVVEGVCLRYVVDGMRYEPALSIYIAKVGRSAAGDLIWRDGADMQAPESDAENWLRREVINYHHRVQPHATSDFVLVRRDDLQPPLT